MITDPSVSAGFWGTIGKCDIPYRTMENMLKHISDTQHVSKEKYLTSYL